MKMNGVQAYDSNAMTDTKLAVSDNSSNTYQIGQELEGIISNVSDQISINFSGKEVKVPSSAVKDAKEGETRTFQIMDISKNGIVLKEVGSTKKQVENKANLGVMCTQVEVDQSALLSKESNTKEEEDDADLEKVSNKMSAADYEQLSQEGISLESYGLERLERALERIKIQRDEKSIQLEQQIETLDQNVEDARKIAKSVVSSDQVVQQIVEQLMNLNLPVTQDNVLKLAKAMDMVTAVTQMNDSSSSYLIKNELSPTIENIYKAVHSRETSPSNHKEEVFEQLKDSIHTIIEEANIEDYDTALSTAKWLLDSDLPVTAENIEYKMSLDQLSTHLNMSDITKNAVEALKNGYEAESANVLENPKASYEQLMKSIDSIQDSTITEAVRRQQTEHSELNLETLIHIQQESIAVPLMNEVNQSASINAITAKRQLEEIRLKLTYDASNQLAGKGIKIETQDLSKVVSELRAMEQDYYKNLMKEVSADSSASQVSLLQGTQEAIQNIKQSGTYLLGQTFLTRHTISLSELSDVATTTQARFQHAEESYEALMTTPRRDMGDSIQKAFESVDSQLESLGLELTQSNQRAIRILGYNNMELTTENVVAMKAYDAKVNELLNNLSPSITAEMIKDHVNPLNIPIDDLNEITLQYQNSLGVESEVDYSEFLVDLGANKKISTKERETYIGIYRLLHQVEANDGAAIGALAKSGKELTLNNLLTEVRTRKQGDMDVSIDDHTMIKTSTGYQNSITDSINSYYSELVEYNESVVRNIQKNVSAESLSEVMNQSNGNMNDISLEKMKEIMQEQSKESLHQNAYERCRDIQELAKESKEYVSFLNSYQETDSISNMETLRTYVENNISMFEQISETIKKDDREQLQENSYDLTQKMVSKEELQKSYEGLSDHLLESLKNAIWEEDRTGEEVKSINAMRDILKLSANLASKEYYNIPITTDDKIVNMSLTVIHNSETKGKLRIQLPLEGLGNITVQASVDQKKVSAFITSDEAEGIQKMNAQKDEFVAKLESNGFTVGQLNFGTEKVQINRFIFATGNIYKEAQNDLSKETDVSTNELYGVSKLIVEQLTKLA